MTTAWDDDPAVAAWSRLPALDHNRTTDACVVGLGVSGLAAVEALVAQGLRVVGLDAGRIACGAAGSNGGFLLGGAADFLHTSIARFGTASVDLYRDTLLELDRVARQLGSGVVNRVGSIRLAGLPGDPLDTANFAAELDDCTEHAKALRDNGIAVEEYAGELGRGLFLPDDAAVNPARRALGTAALLLAHADLYEHSAAREVRSGTVTTDYGVISAPVIIVAVDGRLEHVFPQLRGRIRTARLQMLATTTGLPARLPCPVYGRWGYDYAQQGPDGRIYAGGGRDLFREHEWTTEQTPTANVQSWIEEVATRMAGQPIQVTRRWAASVGFTRDGRALCTEVSAGVVACGGYNGTGNLVGPLAARAAVAFALDGKTPPPYLAA